MPSSPSVIGFGSNYFYALGGTEPATLIHDNGCPSNEDESNQVNAYSMTDPPWTRKKDTVVQVVCSSTATIFVTQQGRVYQTGTLHGDVSCTPARVEVAFPRKCVQVAAGRHFCIGRLEQGVGVVSWGAGHFGQLGLGPHVSGVDKPQLISHLLPQALGTTRVQQVAAGAWHALALLDNGKVMAWGSNRKYQCGIKPTKSPPTIVTPQPIEFYGKFQQVACGRLHSVALEEGTGRVYTWGASHYGQCGQFSRKTCIAPPRLVEALQKVVVVDIAAGDMHSLALTGGGRIFGWGSGMDGQLGLGGVVTISRPKLVADLDFISIEAGREWKQQQQQQQAQQEMPATRVPSESSAGHVYTSSPQRANKQADTIQATPPQRDAESIASSKGRPPNLANVPKIVSIEASGSYSVAISSSGHVYTWGYNDVGQLGLPPPSQKLPYVEVTSTTMKPSSTLRLLQIRSFDSRCNVLLPRRVDALSDYFITSVAAGPCHLWCIGNPRDEGLSDVVGRTLYEVQEGRRRKGLVRLREQLSAIAASKSPPTERVVTAKESPLEDLMIPDIVLTPATSTVVDHDGASTTTLETQPSLPLSPTEVAMSGSFSPSKQAMQMPTKHDDSPIPMKQQDVQTPTRQDEHMPLPEMNSLKISPSGSSSKPSPPRGLGRSLSLSKLMSRKRDKSKSKSRPKQAYKELTDSPGGSAWNGEPPSPIARPLSSHSAADESFSQSRKRSEADFEPLEPLNGDFPSPPRRGLPGGYPSSSPLGRGLSMSGLIQRARKSRLKGKDDSFDSASGWA